MRIAYIVPSLLRRGPVVMLSNLVHHLSNQVERIDLYYFDDASDAMTFDCNTIKIKMTEPFDFDSYDIIHSHCFRADRYLAKWIKHIKSAKTVSTLHQDTFASFAFQYGTFFSYFLTWYWCRLQSRFDLVVSISNQLKDIYINKISTKIVTIYNGCSININNNGVQDCIKEELLRWHDKGFVVLGTYAYITERKGLSQILSVLRTLESYAFVIIGEGPYVETLKKQVERWHLSDRVLFFPYQKSPYNYLQFIDVYVMPSYSEGFGLAMVEAALGGKSIVCSDIQSFRELFSNDEVSFFTLHDIQSLKLALNTAYSNRISKGNSANIKAKTKFTSEVMAYNYLDVYKSISAIVE